MVTFRHILMQLSLAGMLGIFLAPRIGLSQEVIPCPNTSRKVPRREIIKKTPYANVRISKVECIGYAQESTLADERLSKTHLKGPLVSVARMHPEDFFEKNHKEQVEWFRSKLCPYLSQLEESANRNRVPTQLIAAVILNELTDITAADQIQDATPSAEGSVGPAQMLVRKTAFAFKHVDIPCWIGEMNGSATNPIDNWWSEAQVPYMSDPFEIGYVQGRLRVMQVAIEAAAREIRRLLDRMNSSSPWQAQHGYTGPSPDSAPHANIYFEQGFIRGDSPQMRFMYLCDLVIAAYNSRDIVDSLNPGASFLVNINAGARDKAYLDARTHGFNGARLAKSLFKSGLFHSVPVQDSTGGEP